MKYVSAKEAKKYFQISGQTLKVWKDTNKILTKQFSQKKILYDIDSVNNDNNITNNRKNVIYARVSCSNQKQSLDNQIELIKSYMISNGIKVDDIYSEIASGLNEDRKELSRLIHDIDNEYWWVVNNIRENRLNYTKSKLVSLGYDKHLTEIEIMHSLKYYRIFGPGNLKFIYKKKSL